MFSNHLMRMLKSMLSAFVFLFFDKKNMENNVCKSKILSWLFEYFSLKFLSFNVSQICSLQ